MGEIQPSARDGGQTARRSESLAKLNRAARRLFVERGYHATRPQDIAREAGLGHGTFYLHYADKRACFLAFVEAAREELDVYVRQRRVPDANMESWIANTIVAIHDYSRDHPGVLRAALTDESLIDAEGGEGTPLLIRWGQEWAQMLRESDGAGDVDCEIAGQAIVGAIHQVSRAAARGHLSREALVENLTRFILRALSTG